MGREHAGMPSAQALQLQLHRCCEQRRRACQRRRRRRRRRPAHWAASGRHVHTHARSHPQATLAGRGRWMRTCWRCQQCGGCRCCCCGRPAALLRGEEAARRQAQARPQSLPVQLQPNDCPRQKRGPTAWRHELRWAAMTRHQARGAAQAARLLRASRARLQIRSATPRCCWLVLQATRQLHCASR